MTLNSSELKKSVIQHCLLWQIKLGELLRTMAEYDIDTIYSYVERSSEEAMRVKPGLTMFYLLKFLENIKN